MDYGMDACIYDWMEESTDEKKEIEKEEESTEKAMSEFSTVCSRYLKGLIK